MVENNEINDLIKKMKGDYMAEYNEKDKVSDDEFKILLLKIQQSISDENKVIIEKANEIINFNKRKEENTLSNKTKKLGQDIGKQLTALKGSLKAKLSNMKEKQKEKKKEKKKTSKEKKEEKLKKKLEKLNE